MSTLVFDNKDLGDGRWSSELGLPFSRIRMLQRLARQPMTVKQIAEAATIDAPAATVAVNDLEDRGLVVRRDRSDEPAVQGGLADRRRAATWWRRSTAVDDPAPDALAALERRSCETLRDIVDRCRR